MSNKAKVREQLAALKTAREGGKRDYKPKADEIYDEVDDDTYQEVVKGRLQEDDFIEEDQGVSGYADNGMDDWDRSDDSEIDSEEEARKRAKKKAKKEAKEEEAKKLSAAAAKKKARQSLIAPGANPYINPNREQKIGRPLPEQEDNFMASLLGDLDGQATVVTETKVHKSQLPKSYSSSSIMKKRKSDADSLSSFRSKQHTFGASSSDVSGSDDLLGGRETGPSSDGMESAAMESKRTRFEDGEEDLGGMDMDMMDFPDPALVGNATEDIDMAEVVKAEDADSDEDDISVKPTTAAAPKSRGPAKPRQLVNGAAVKITPKPEPIEEKLPEASPAAFNQYKTKSKGMDWKLATSALASASTSAISTKEEEDEELDLLPVPESLKSGKHYVAPAMIVKNATALEEDGSVRFWWFDYVEAIPGVVCLVGKVKANDGKWVSACVKVNGIKRKLYVLPRAKALDMDGNEMDDDDDEPPEFDDVEMDFENDAKERWGVQELEITPGWVQRKYAFGIKGVPREETNWLEATCNFPAKNNDKGERVDIPMDAKGERYSHVFGTNNSGFELFVIKHKIMGPCWLNFKKCTPRKEGAEGISWTKFEVEVDEEDVSVLSQDSSTPKPPLTILSLSARSVLHITENKREIVCASARVYQDSNIDDPTRIEQQPSSVTTLVRPLFGPFPKKFEEMAKASRLQKSKGINVTPMKDERALLTQLLAVIYRYDPDVIVGHDFSALDLDVLLNRLKDLKIDNWSRIGRFRRPKWPRLIPGKNSALVSGRLILDLSSDGSKAIIDSTTWSLTEMCETHLNINREDIDPEDTPRFFDEVHSTAANLLHFVGHCEADCYFQMAIAFKVQALPLTRQLTNLAGNSWNKTLAGNRNERNEYILLHRFNEHGYVCPDKETLFEKKKKAEGEAKKVRAKARKNGEDEITIVQTKEKFKGGLVFDPKKGLWDRFVLVMDYNSLYPSIIQEYDIDFSTIDWTADGAEDLDKMPDRGPCDGEPQGILPQLIASLVERRRNVKRNMKDKNVSQAKLLQYDITQKALKLTANSMYGCLGYEGSRFYARPLAALTTFKGREILQRTKADAENLALDVIYGDTDSVMINTNVTELQEALRIGDEFKKLINQKYKKLEIDTDAIFQRMLLLNKKKYAALKVSDNPKEPAKMEFKGLDMVRREYCEISKETSRVVLDQLLGGESTEVAIEQVHEHLEILGKDVREGKVPTEKFIIFKRLGKNPQDYPDAKSLPHVQVALRMKSKGQSAKSGDVIPYIYCLPEDGISAKSAKAANAHHPDDVKRIGSTLKIDFEVYLSTQILPPVERLCDPIEGTEKARLAECLGLDVTRYKAVGEEPEREFKTLQSQISDAQRFAKAEPFLVRCRPCGEEAVFDGIDSNTAHLIKPDGLSCSNTDCGRELSFASVSIQLDLRVRSFIAKFYETWLVCDDSSCANRTRMMSVYGRRCLMAGCKGQMHYEYTDSMLYNQLLFLDSLFDLEKIKTKVAGTSRQEEVEKLVEGNKILFGDLRKIVTKHLDKNGRRWVSMGPLFSFMR